MATFPDTLDIADALRIWNPMMRILDANQGMTNNILMQNVFTVAPSLPLAANKTYWFEGLILTTNGATSHGLNLQFAAIAGATIAWRSCGSKSQLNLQAVAIRNSQNDTFATPRNVTTASTVQGNEVHVIGTIRTTLAGNFTPQISQTAASGAFTVLRGTYFLVQEIGADTLTNTGEWV